MLNEIKNSLKKIQDSNDFIEWKNKHKNSYLTSAFLNSCIWQFDFLNINNDKVTSFKIDSGVVSSEESDIFRKEKNEIKELKLYDIKIDLDNAEDLIKKLIDSDYKNEEIQKKIIILQVIDEPAWNITYITKSFNVLNVKINAINGKIINHSMENLLNFRVKS